MATNRGARFSVHKGLLATLFFTGFLGIGFEILVVRMLSQIMENTVYSFAVVLAVYLLGVAMGAGLYQRTWARDPAPSKWRSRLSILLLTTASSCLLSAAGLWVCNNLYTLLNQILPNTMMYAILAELTIAAVVLLLPTLVMGALFSHLSQRAIPLCGLGMALGWNTLGSALAPMAFGILLLPLLGAKFLFMFTACGYLALYFLYYFIASSSNKASSRSLVWSTIPCSVMLTALIIPAPLRFVTLDAHSEVIDYNDGVMAAVAVVEDGAGDRHLKVNNHFTMGGTASRLSDHRQTHLPMLLHGEPKSALYLGLGTGISFDAAQYYPKLKAMAVELIPEAIEVMDQFGVKPTTWATQPQVLAADARRFVMSDPNHYDVIIAEIFHPSRDGAGALYTVEHFQAVKQRLNKSGVFCQWLPLFQLDIATFKTIVRSFLQVFPQAQLHLGHLSLNQPILCLAGFNQPKKYHQNWLLEKIHDPALQQQLVQTRLNSDFAFLGGYIGSGNALATFAGEGPINTDDNPVVVYSAPNFVYRPQQSPAVSLKQLLDTIETEPEQLIAVRQTAFSQRMARYWQARNQFLETGMAFTADQDITKIIAASKQPLLSIIADSPDFEPAYRTLLMGAQALSQVDPYGAYTLLSEMQAVSPKQPQAAQLRQRLFGN